MAKLIATLIAFHLAGTALAHGEKAKPVPRLSPETLAAIGATQPLAPAAPTSQTVATCFAGYTLYSDGSCVKEIDEPAIQSTGEVTLPYILTCPAGYEPTPDGICARSTYGAPDFFCPVGYADDGAFCTSTNGSPLPEKVCDMGELVGNNCIARITAPYLVTPECPEGSVAEEDGGCWKIVDTFDCTPQEIGKNGRVVSAARPTSGFQPGQHIRVTKGGHPHTHLETIGHAHGGHHHGHHHRGGAIARALGKKKQHAHHHENHSKEAPIAPFPGTSLVNPVPAFPVELPLLVEDGLAAAPGNANAAILGIGEPADNECTKDLVAVTPPHAFKIGLATQTCTKKIQVEALALVSCPDGYFDDGTACVKEIITEPFYSCPGGGAAVDGICVGPVTRIPKIQKCADGTAPVNGQCLIIDTLPGHRSCGAGFTDVGTGCFGLVSTGEGLECPEGLALIGDRCVGQIVRPAVAVTMLSEPLDCSK